MSQVALMKSEDLSGMISVDRYSRSLLGLLAHSDGAERMKCSSVKELSHCVALVID